MAKPQSTKSCECCGKVFYLPNRPAQRFCSHRCAHRRYRGTFAETFSARVRQMPSGCWEWTGAANTTNGYGRIYVKTDASGRQLSRYAHRVAWEIANGWSVPDGLHVLHHCDNRICVNPFHLFVGTDRDNVDDCRSKLRHAFGERNGHAKLTMVTVRELREVYATGNYSLRELTVRFGITAGTVLSAVRGRNWKHAGGPISKTTPRNHRLRGEKHLSAKLTWSQVRAIRASHVSGENCARLSERYGVTLQCVWAIVKGKTWKESA